MNSNLSYKKFEPFTYKSLDDLKNKISELGLEIPISSDMDLLRQPINIKNINIPNRLAIQPMEGFDATENGSPSELTVRRYKRYAEGGPGLIWFEATAIEHGCRTNEHQLILSEDTCEKFKTLLEEVKKKSSITLRELGFNTRCGLILQLNHSGRYTKRKRKRYPIRAFHSENLDLPIGVSQNDGIIIADEELKRLEDIWVEKALLAYEAGFDGVDIKACHGYLICELLSARTRENSKYGGMEFDNRTRFLLNIIRKLNKKLGPNSKFLITTRISAYTGIPYPEGFGIKEIQGESFPATIDLIESIELSKKLYALGLRLLNISAGNPYYRPEITRPYDTPIKNGLLPSEHPLYSINRLINLASIIKKQLPSDIIITGSGYTYLRQFAALIAAGLIKTQQVDICGFGRMAFANPNFPKQIFQEGIIDKQLCCIACSKCTQFMREGKNTGCAIRDPVYKD